jgi:small neutral amino acid transporter SnatA (MarC family)
VPVPVAITFVPAALPPLLAGPDWAMALVIRMHKAPAMVAAVLVFMFFLSVFGASYFAPMTS